MILEKSELDTLLHIIWGSLGLWGLGNLHFNQCLREFPWEPLAPEDLGVFLTLRFLEKETVPQDQSKLPKSSWLSP